MNIYEKIYQAAKHCIFGAARCGGCPYNKGVYDIAGECFKEFMNDIKKITKKEVKKDD